MDQSIVTAVKCGNYETQVVLSAARQALDLAGGITSFVKPRSRVLIKPNLLMSKAPECAITTHPEIVRALIRLLKEINCKIAVGDAPSAFARYNDNVDEVYQATGMKELCRQEEVDLVYFDKRRMRDKFPLAAALDEYDHLINAPKLKTHGLTLMTGAVKNFFGLVTGTFKIELHKNYFAQEKFAGILVDIFQEAKPAFTLIDAVTCLEGDGPGSSGTPRQVGLLLAGTDCVALDAVAAKIMGIPPGRVLTTKEACRRGLGVEDLARISIKGEDIDKLNIRPFALPKNYSQRNNIPPAAVQVFKALIKYYPYSLDPKCTLCGNCAKVCPQQCISFKNKKMRVNYKKCIRCFCCQEICPQGAISLKKSLLARTLGL